MSSGPCTVLLGIVLMFCPHRPTARAARRPAASTRAGRRSAGVESWRCRASPYLAPSAIARGFRGVRRVSWVLSPLERYRILVRRARWRRPRPRLAVLGAHVVLRQELRHAFDGRDHGGHVGIERPIVAERLDDLYLGVHAHQFLE